MSLLYTKRKKNLMEVIVKHNLKVWSSHRDARGDHQIRVSLPLASDTARTMLDTI